jgi:NAD(P)-dependent dehydrogenase (short-subunit alcohol dehydrogenase family)
MSSRIRDTTLASTFTTTLHKSPYSSIDPSTNKLPSPLTVLIIGASRGIGAHIAYAYAQAGTASLILSARASSTPTLKAVEQHCLELSPGVKTAIIPADITSAESVEALSKRVKEEFGHLDVVVLNSGWSGPVVLNMHEGSPQDFQDVFDTNVQGTYLVAHYFVPLLLSSNGSKVFIAVGSFAACITSGHIANTAYCVSKFAQTRLIEFLGEQYGAEGLLSVAVHPGAVLTEMADSTTPESFRPYLTDDLGLCGAFLVWLCQEKRMWMNGRLVGATWDTAELEGRKGEIVEQDLLKWGFRVGEISKKEIGTGL